MIRYLNLGAMAIASWMKRVEIAQKDVRLCSDRNSNLHNIDDINKTLLGYLIWYQLSIVYVTEVDYTQVRGLECNDDKEHLQEFSYDSLSEALRTCASDNKCVGIVDYNCNNEDEFYYCTSGWRFAASQDYRKHCIYKKAEHYGKPMN